MRTLNNLFKHLIVSFFICGYSVFALAQTQISDAVGLAAISKDLSGSYILTANITLTGSWTPIANFKGTLDGNGHIINGLTYNNAATPSVALFASTSGATIKKLGIEKANLVGQQNVAALVGIMSGGTIEQCYVSNSYIQGTDHVASLVGQTVSGATIKNCYASASIFATSNNTGGLVGSAKESTLSRCYFSGMIRSAGGSQSAAGLVGYSETGFTPVVEYCVNLAPYIITSGGSSLRIIPNVTRPSTLTKNYSLSSSLIGTSYLLSALAVVPTNSPYYGLSGHHGANLPSDSDAKSSTFYSGTLGWDFTATNGIWKMLSDGYPVLQWQTTPVNSTVLNLNASANLNILDIASFGLDTIGQVDFSKLISSHGVALNFSCTNPKVTISAGKIATIQAGTSITTTENVSVKIAANIDFSVTNSVATLKLSANLHSIPFPNLGVYPDGLISPVYNAGPGMAIDQTSTNTEDSKLVVISATSLQSFTAYIQTLLKNGFTQISNTSIEKNVFYTLTNNNKLYYLYFTGATNQVRIIEDNSTRTLLSELDATAQGAGTTEFYLYSLDYTHGEGQTSTTDYWKIDCGTMIFVKLADNSLFIIDSGHERQSSKAALEGIVDFMYKITGQTAGTTLNIRGWFFSHAHGDHVYMTYPFLEKYHDVLNVESVLFNIPSFQTMGGGYDAGTFLMKKTFNTYYPNCKYVKLHTGQTFTLQGVQIDVLHTHEDAVDVTGKNVMGDFNDTSTILKMILGGKKIMLLGDGGSVCQSDMLTMYTSATLRSDCVQTAHHAYNNVPALYAAIAAPLALFNNSRENVSATSEKYLGVINATSNVKVLFADPDTYKITVENGIFKTVTVPSYRSYFKTVALPNLKEETITTSGTKVTLSTILKETSLAGQVIDKSVTGTPGNISESCSLILDGATSTKFCSTTVPATFAWTMKSPVTLKWYTIYSANDNATRPLRNPQKWVLCGSNDGTSWTSIDSVSNPKLPDTNFTGTAFAVSNPTAYQYYALKVFSTDGSDVLQFSEIGLYGEMGTTAIPYEVKTKDETVLIGTNANNQITVNYTGNLSRETSLSVYNMVGQKVLSKRISDAETVIAVPGSGIFIVVVGDEQRRITKKVRLL